MDLARADLVQQQRLVLMHHLEPLRSAEVLSERSSLTVNLLTAQAYKQYKVRPFLFLSLYRNFSEFRNCAA